MRALIAVPAILLLAASSATAAPHSFDTTFAGTAPNNVVQPRDIAIDHATGDVYVVDDDQFHVNTDGDGNNRVVKFDEDGNFILMFGRDVNKTTGGDICTAASGDLCGPGVSGISPGMFSHATFVAVDNSNGPSAGSVYVGEIGTAAGPASISDLHDPQGPNRIQKFTSQGALQSDWGDAIPVPNGTMVGTEAPAGVCLQLGFTDSGLGGVAVDNVGRLYWSCDAEIYRYGQDGSYQSRIQATGGQEPNEPGSFIFQGGLETDSQRNLYAILSGFSFYRLKGDAVWKMGPSFNHLGQVVGDTSGIMDQAIDPSGDEIYTTAEGLQSQPFGGSVSECDTTPAECHLGGGKVIKHYGVNGGSVLDSFGAGVLNGARGMAVNPVNDDVYVANTGDGNVAVFEGTVPAATGNQPAEIGETTATLSGTADPLGRGAITQCYFEYGLTQSYGQTIPCSPDPESAPPGSNFTVPTQVTAEIEKLQKRAIYNFRLVVANAQGQQKTKNLTFATSQPPSVNGVYASDLRADSATLNARVNPNSSETSYWFEYGKTVEYGQKAPVEGGSLSAGGDEIPVSEEITGLDGGVYHFRLVAQNEFGVTRSPDQTFNFFPPECPNQRVRQQSKGAYLPDCRAYELVSPEFANGTLFLAMAPTVPWGQVPSGRFGYTGLFGIVPDSGNPQNFLGDLYISSRTSTGWVNRYVGVPGAEGVGSGSPPWAPAAFPSAGGVLTDTNMNRFVSWARMPEEIWAPYLFDNEGNLLDRLPLDVEADHPEAFEFFTWRSEQKMSGDASTFVFSSVGISWAEGGLQAPPGSVYADNLATGERTIVSKAPGGVDIPSDPAAPTSWMSIPEISQDGSHILIGTNAPSNAKHLYMTIDGTDYNSVSRRHDGVNVGVTYTGMTEDGEKVFFTTPTQMTTDDTDGSIDLYVWSAATDTVSLLSQGSETQSVQVDATGGTFTLSYDGEETAPIAFDAPPPEVEAALEALSTVDARGVTITGGPGDAGGTSPYFVSFNSAGDAVLLEADGGALTGGAASVDVRPPGSSVQRIQLVGTTGGSYKLRFAGEETAAIPRSATGAELDAALEALPAIGAGGVEVLGETPFYQAAFNLGLGVPRLEVASNDLEGTSKEIIITTHTGPTGNTSTCLGPFGSSQQCNVVVVPENVGGAPPPLDYPLERDNSISTHSGDVYFYSPERLVADAEAAQPGQRNLYVLHDGELKFVVSVANNNALKRLQVTPDGERAAFITAQRLTSYDNQSTDQMYTFDPATETLTCVSCRPDGNPPSGNVEGSQIGRFITDDGRTFFSTKVALSNRDVNGIADVYEYVEGRPQLISTGTGTVEAATFNPVGLVGVSADGIDVFFNAFETIVAQDANGASNKYYTARTNGGFPADPPPPPCAAADECHADNSTPPPPLRIGSGATTPSGNLRKPRRKCARGKVRRKGRCVKSKRSRRKKAGKRRARSKHAGRARGRQRG